MDGTRVGRDQDAHGVLLGRRVEGALDLLPRVVPLPPWKVRMRPSVSCVRSIASVSTSTRYRFVSPHSVNTRTRRSVHLPSGHTCRRSDARSAAVLPSGAPRARSAFARSSEKERRRFLCGRRKKAAHLRHFSGRFLLRSVVIDAVGLGICPRSGTP